MDPAEEQFNAIYEAYADAIFRHLYFKIGDRDRALELTQEVFGGYWKRLVEGAEIEHPKAFLYRSAHNAFVNELRDHKATVSLESMTDKGFDVVYDAADAEEVAVQKEVVEKIQEIDEPYRSALILRYIDGLPVKTIATLVGENENTVSVRIKRGIEKIRKIYG